MSEVFSKVEAFTFHIESYQCDFNEKVRLAGIINHLLDASTEHAEKRGFGYTSLKEDGKAWVLSRLAIEIYEYPKIETNLTVKTWVESVCRTFTHRCFSIHDDDGKAIGYAKSIWAAIDMQTRKPVIILDLRPDLNNYIDSNTDCPIDDPTKIPVVTENAYSSFTVRYNDIDINKHVNSVRYIEHIMDTFEMSYFSNKNIRKFEIAYLAESTFGDELTIHKHESEADEFLFEIKNNTTSVCRSRLCWK